MHKSCKKVEKNISLSGFFFLFSFFNNNEKNHQALLFKCIILNPKDRDFDFIYLEVYY